MKIDKSIKFQIRRELSPEQIESACSLYSSLPEVHLDQHPKWQQVLHPYKNMRCCVASKNGETLCYTKIYEGFYKQAYIHFGPLCQDRDLLVESLRNLVTFYKSQGFWGLGIQFGQQVSNTTQYAEYLIHRDYPVRFSISRANWSSVVVNLEPPIDVIHAGFSSNHRRSIRKAQKHSVVVADIQKQQDYEAFYETFLRMRRARKLHTKDSIIIGLKKRIDFIERFNAGNLFGIWNDRGKLIGGAVFLHHGQYFFYDKGCADPEVRNIPVLHTLFYEVMKIAKAEGFKYLDLGGYNHFVSDNEQISSINRFKRGFSTDYTFYPPRFDVQLNRITNPFFHKIYQTMRRIISI